MGWGLTVCQISKGRVGFCWRIKEFCCVVVVKNVFGLRMFPFMMIRATMQERVYGGLYSLISNMTTLEG